LNGEASTGASFCAAAVSNHGMRRWSSVLCVIATLSLMSACRRNAYDKMSFFVTSVQAGNGGAIGGLAAADAHCQQLAAAVGATKRDWRAYLSATGPDGSPIHARQRIGTGPWFNVRGVQVAANVDDLHGPANKLGRTTSLTERGNPPSQHDILTGSNADGTLTPGDATCNNWTSTQGHAMVGHSNKEGSCCGESARSWNSAHVSEGCTLAALQSMGGAALFYCFAED
jgi:hypothetical protein